jgi:peptidoglycan/LPS O-acetylase OafA/YrhL
MSPRRWFVPIYLAAIVLGFASAPYWWSHHYWNRSRASLLSAIALTFIGLVALCIRWGFRRSRRAGWITVAAIAAFCLSLAGFSLISYLASKSSLTF